MPSIRPCIALFTLLIAGLSQPAAALCVSAAEAHLREGPGKHYRKTWTVYQYMPLQSLGNKGRWTQVRDEVGNTGWVASTLLWSLRAGR